MKLATFTWSITIEVPDDFDDKYENDKFREARNSAYLNIQKGDGELTDLQDRD